MAIRRKTAPMRSNRFHGSTKGGKRTPSPYTDIGEWITGLDLDVENSTSRVAKLFDFSCVVVLGSNATLGIALSFQRRCSSFFG